MTEIPWIEKRDPRATHYLEIALTGLPLIAGVPTRNDPSSEARFRHRYQRLDGRRQNQQVLTGMRALFAALRPRIPLALSTLTSRRAPCFHRPKSAITSRSLQQGSAPVGGGGRRRYRPRDGSRYGWGRKQRDARCHQPRLPLLRQQPDGRHYGWLRFAQPSKPSGTSIRVSTFGFGADANGRGLDALAGITGGSYTPVSNPASLGDNLAEDLARREALVAKETSSSIRRSIPRISLSTSMATIRLPSPSLARRRARYDKRRCASHVRVRRGKECRSPCGLAADEAYWVVLEVAVPESLETELGLATAVYVDAASSQYMEDALTLETEARPTTLPAHVMIQHAVGLWSSEVAFYALDDLSQDDLSTASARLTAHTAGARETASAQLERTWLGKDLELCTRWHSSQSHWHREASAHGRQSTRARCSAIAWIRSVAPVAVSPPRKPHSQPDNDQARSYRGSVRTSSRASVRRIPASSTSTMASTGTMT